MACKFVYLSRQRLLRRKIACTVDLKAYSNSNDDKSKKGQDSIQVTSESLQWRTPWNEKEGEWYSKLKLFSSDQNNTDVIKFLQSNIDLRPSSIKQWYKDKMEEAEIQMQQYMPQRNEILGNDLAAAHFIIYRGGSVKFHGDSSWLIQNETLHEKLPNKYVPHMIVQSIDCSNVNLYYEGLANIQKLDKLEWLSLKNCKNMDDWCLDRISGSFQDSLLYLDIRNCEKITDRGVGALYRTRKLRTLLIDDVTRSQSLELTCLMLQEILPNLEIKSQL